VPNHLVASITEATLLKPHPATGLLRRKSFHPGLYGQINWASMGVRTLRRDAYVSIEGLRTAAVDEELFSRIRSLTC